MRRLFLDDLRQPHEIYPEIPEDQWELARNYAEFKTALAQGIPDIISLDHDLSEEHYRAYLKDPLRIDYSSFKHKTGYHCLLHLIEICLERRQELPKCHVHTFNPAGADNMRALIDNFNQTSALFGYRPTFAYAPPA